MERTFFPGDPKHPDAESIARLFPPNRFGGLVSFELKGAGRAEVFRFMEKLKMVVRATSLGDVHTLILYPAMASHRDLSPKHRERLGIRDNLMRISVGIEAVEDIVADLEQALSLENLVYCGFYVRRPASSAPSSPPRWTPWCTTGSRINQVNWK